MIEIGEKQELKAYKLTSQGMYLADEEGDEILLPTKFCPSDLKVGGTAEVFVYSDSDDRLVATTQEPLIELYGFAYLMCTGVTGFGAFMAWGMDRDLIIPNREQQEPIEVGLKYLTYLFINDADQLTGTTNIEQCLDHEDIDVKVGDKVDLLVYDKTNLGYKVIINNIYGGVIYHDDVYDNIKPMDQIQGYIRRIRGDKLIDVSLRPFGYSKVKEQSDPILKYLEEKGGFAPLHDKSDPALIKSELKMSKKVFKKAIGGLYKKGMITINDKGITIVKK